MAFKFTSECGGELVMGLIHVDDFEEAKAILDKFDIFELRVGKLGFSEKTINKEVIKDSESRGIIKVTEE